MYCIQKQKKRDELQNKNKCVHHKSEHTESIKNKKEKNLNIDTQMGRVDLTFNLL